MGRRNGPGLQSGGGPCLKRGMSKLLRHGLGHANSHFETASSPTSEYLEFPRRAHSSIPALFSNHCSAMTLVGARRRFSGSSSCAACCTAAECQPDALLWCNTGPFSSCGLSGHDEATATDIGDISCHGGRYHYRTGVKCVSPFTTKTSAYRCPKRQTTTSRWEDTPSGLILDRQNLFRLGTHAGTKVHRRRIASYYLTLTAVM